MSALRALPLLVTAAIVAQACLVSLDESKWKVAADAQQPEGGAIDGEPADGPWPPAPDLAGDATRADGALPADTGPQPDGPPVDITPPLDGPGADGPADASPLDGPSSDMGCSDACAAGATRCAGGMAEQACALGPQGCRVWAQPVPCDPNETCAAGSCAESCSGDGVPSDCDPLASGGCPGAGVCYLTVSGPACVCPIGSAGVGSPCQTTVDCQPKMVCAGSSPPGSCRALCKPGNPDCPPGSPCLPITGRPGYGFCSP